MNRWQLLVHRVSVWLHVHAIEERFDRALGPFVWGMLTGMLVVIARLL